MANGIEKGIWATAPQDATLLSLLEYNLLLRSTAENIVDDTHKTLRRYRFLNKTIRYSSFGFRDNIFPIDVDFFLDTSNYDQGNIP